MGDATEDLLELIKGLKGLQWRFKHYCQTDSLWHFRFLCEHQLALLIVNLLRYMEVKKMQQRVLE